MGPCHLVTGRTNSILPPFAKEPDAVNAPSEATASSSAKPSEAASESPESAASQAPQAQVSLPPPVLAPGPPQAAAPDADDDDDDDDPFDWPGSSDDSDELGPPVGFHIPPQALPPALAAGLVHYHGLQSGLLPHFNSVRRVAGLDDQELAHWRNRSQFAYNRLRVGILSRAELLRELPDHLRRPLTQPVIWRIDLGQLQQIVIAGYDDYVGRRISAA